MSSLTMFTEDRECLVAFSKAFDHVDHHANPNPEASKEELAACCSSVASFLVSETVIAG